jgi:hypothetical protein
VLLGTLGGWNSCANYTARPALSGERVQFNAAGKGE